MPIVLEKCLSGLLGEEAFLLAVYEVDVGFDFGVAFGAVVDVVR